MTKQFFKLTSALVTAMAITACQTTPVQNAVVTEINAVQYVYASSDQAADILTRDDNFMAHLQANEIAIRMGDSSKTDTAALKAQYRQGVALFTPEESKFLDGIIAELEPSLTKLNPHLPREILLAKNTKLVDGGLSHTRANMILFSAADLAGMLETRATDPEKAKKDLTGLFLHELHHVLTRHNQDRHDAYYSIIGFEPCDLSEPDMIKANRLTNPDTVTYEHYLPAAVEGGDGVVPFLKIKAPYDDEKKGGLGAYFDFGLLVVNETNGSCAPSGSVPTFLSPSAVPGFLESIGKNTGYIIHPEETLADNFIYFITQKPDLPNPEIPKQIGKFWGLTD